MLETRGPVFRLYNLRIKNEPSDVLLGHPRKLVGKNTLESQKPEVMLWRGRDGKRVVQNLEPQQPLLLLLLGSIVSRHLVIKKTGL